MKSNHARALFRIGRILLLLGLPLVAVAFAGERLVDLVVAPLSGDTSEQEIPTMPAGFWTHTERFPARTRAGAEERARVLSLPYLGGRSPVGPRDRQVGVTHLDSEHAYPGGNLYTSGHGPEAILMDMEGKVLHRWRRSFEDAFPGVAPTVDTGFFRRVALLDDGTLVALYQTGGLVFLNQRSVVLGRCEGNFYNDLWLDDGGRIWTIAKQVEPAQRGPARLDDFLVELHFENRGERCEEVRRISITRAFLDSDYRDLLEPMSPEGDVLHGNTVMEVDGTGSASFPALAPGNLLISLREIDIVALVDPESRRVVWAQRGPWAKQHEPVLLPSGRILLFDNQGDPRGSRILELDPTSGEIVWSWQGDPPESFRSPIAGAAARLPNGDTLVTESTPGRALEFDPQGRIVWEFRTPHRAGPANELVATLFEVQRIPDHLLPSSSEQ